MPLPSTRPAKTAAQKRLHPAIGWGALGVVTIAALAAILFSGSLFAIRYSIADADKDTATTFSPPSLDKAAYDLKMLELAHVSTTTIASLVAASTTGPRTLSSFTAASLASSTIGVWPTRAPYPQLDALLPSHRIVAYYGNFYSKGMGVLGEYSEDEVISKLNAEVAKWNAADPSTPVIPAIDYIALTAQGSPGKQGYYMLRMPDDQIDHAIEMADKVHGIVILDVQVGLSDLPRELPMLETYLKMSNVHLAIDPEFAMHNGAEPGTVVGSFDATDINYAAKYLAQLVDEYHLPPKVLIVHRFTEAMVTNYKRIPPLPQVQIVMDMDGWGDPAKKLNTYERVIHEEPVQFTGFKLFYKNDLKPPSTRLLTPAEVLGVTPAPSFIQYQ